VYKLPNAYIVYTCIDMYIICLYHVQTCLYIMMYIPCTWCRHVCKFPIWYRNVCTYLKIYIRVYTMYRQCLYDSFVHSLYVQCLYMSVHVYARWSGFQMYVCMCKYISVCKFSGHKTPKSEKHICAYIACICTYMHVCECIRM
jgi:hypothetical protein